MAQTGAAGRGVDRLIVALAAGKSMPDAAAEAGMSLRTAQRRAAEPVVRSAIQAARTAALERAIALPADGTASAAASLRLLGASASQEHVRLAAARSVIELAFRGSELLDLAARLAALEERLGLDGPTPRIVRGRKGTVSWPQ